ncbi:hypothetical protein JOL62DRAFT_556171 [Phyllosticta paracitricarpa]|uniref:Transaldolase n=1 Tax=Phyllosticta paracitricarpa TaxID=2016321 RepID=A0ABR1N7P5_9PEZI
MGVDTQRPPPLPAPTESSALEDSSRADDLATDISRRTDRSHYSIPDDGTPVTIATKPKEKGLHHRHQSQTSLLIEYFEAGKSGDKVHSRPSVRVRVTPSSKHRKSKDTDHVDITHTDKERKPAYTRRVLLPSGAKPSEGKTTDASELSYSSESNVSGRPPVEVEVMNNVSDLSRSDLSQGRYVPAPSDISSMPPDSLLDAPAITAAAAGLAASQHLKAPERRRSRSLSRERIMTQKIMEKLKDQPESSSKSKHRREKSASSEKSKEEKSRRRASRSRREEALISGTTESSLLASELSRRSADTHSVRSGVSTTSSINNPKLLATVEDAIKRLILPEINALKENQNRANRPVSSSTTSERRVSKSTTTPDVNVVSGDERSTLLSTDVASVKGKKTRRSSRSGSERSYDRHSEDTVTADDRSHRKKSRERHRVRDAALVGGAAAGLTAAALRHHDSHTSIDKKERKKRHSRRGSHATSMSESIDNEGESVKEDVPPLPMASEFQPSEVTRASLLSENTEGPHSVSSRGATPVKEVSRGTPRPVVSPGPRSPTRSPADLRKDTSSFGSLIDQAFETSKGQHGLPPNAQATALTAAGAAAAMASHHGKGKERDESLTPTRDLYRSSQRYEDDQGDQTPRSRPMSAVSGHDVSQKLSDLSLDSASNSPSTNAARSRKRPRGTFESKSKSFDTPRREDVDEFFEHEHEENDALRAEIDEKRLTGYTDDSLKSSNGPLDDRRQTTYTDTSRESVEQNIQVVGEKAGYVHTPAAVESAVASLVDPSTVSVRSSLHNSHVESGNSGDSSEQRRFPADENVFIGQQDNHSGERWGALRDRARNLAQAHARELSPQQSEDSSLRSEHEIEMTANAMPLGEPMPEIGHGLDDGSDVTTNPSEIQGPARTPDRWPYEPTPPMSTKGQRVGEAAALGGAAAIAGVAAANLLRDDHGSPAAEDHEYQPTVEDDYDEHRERYPEEDESYHRRHMTPTSPGHWKDEGYISAAQPGYTPEPHRDRSQSFDGGMPDFTGGLDDDPFVSGGKSGHARNFSGNSHGMSSPIYDSATGKGLDCIQSKDIVALMDHLTVRDAQRNARDTEILVTLVRSAAEMRNSFEEMKKFIAEQDRVIMSNTDRDADMTVQRILNGQPPARSVGRNSGDDMDDMQYKRKNIFKRALRGLSMKNSNDLGKIEEMLMQLLDDVEGLKESTTFAQPPKSQDSRGQSITSYENLRANDPGYEPEGRANTASTPNQSGSFSNPSSSRQLGRHSGYDGRRGSEHRVSTVLEGDEELEENQPDLQGYESERLLTPTQEAKRSTSIPQVTSPQLQESFPTTQSPDTPKTKSKHRSTGSSSLFGPLKISRWSRTTTSTDKESGRSKKNKPYSDASRSGSNVNLTHYDEYAVNSDDRLPSETSLQRGFAYEQGRSPSPLIPEHELENPKYHAHRNSLNLEHPQPRPGPTHRHQTYLESQAVNFDDPQSPDFDQWGSAPSLALNRNRLSSNTGHMSPLSDGGYSNHSASEQVNNSRQRDDGPLVPQEQQNLRASLPFGAKPMHSSPLGNGQYLAPLAPIEEVRYSLETERRSMTPSSPQPASRSGSGRKALNGPRPMGSRSPRPLDHSETVIRRKPVGDHLSQQSLSPISYRSSLESFERDTF